MNLGFTGPGGNVAISADTITISGRDVFGSPSRVSSITIFAGDGGGLSLSARTVTVDAGATVVSQTSDDGRAGDISVNAGSFNLMAGSTIGSHNAASALPGGNVTVTVTGPALISGAGSTTSPTGIFTSSSSGTTPLGDPTPAGRITLDVGSLDLRSQAVIQSGDVTAQGGGITVTAHGPVSITDRAGISSQTFRQDVGSVTLSAPTVVIDGGFINSSTLETGRAGAIVLNVGTLLLTGGGQVASSSVLFATGPAGQIDVTASESITIAGASPTGESVLPAPFGGFVNDARSGIFSTTAGMAPGGNITIRSAQIQLFDGGTISASSTGVILASGPAGHINVTASDSITITGASPSGESVLPVPSGIFSTTAGTGPGGDITLSAPQIRLADGGTISASSTSLLPASEPAGDINVAASGSITITGASPTGASGLFSTTAGTAPGGNITLAAPQIQLADGGTISASSTGVISGERAGRAHQRDRQRLDHRHRGVADRRIGASRPERRLHHDRRHGARRGHHAERAADPAGRRRHHLGVEHQPAPGERAGRGHQRGRQRIDHDHRGVADRRERPLQHDRRHGARREHHAGRAADPAGRRRHHLGVEHRRDPGERAGRAHQRDRQRLDHRHRGVADRRLHHDRRHGARRGHHAERAADPAGRRRHHLGVEHQPAPGERAGRGHQRGRQRIDDDHRGVADRRERQHICIEHQSAAGERAGRDINVAASGSMTITGASPTGASGLFSTTAGTAPGGNITLAAPQIQLADGGTISASSTSLLPASGPAGNIDVTASESITITGASPTGASGLFSTTAGTGPGGNITLAAPQIRLADGGTISASSTGGPSATAGSINIIFGGLFEMDHASISTDSVQADGGNITITSTGSLLHMIDSQITTSVRSGVGGGGNITLGSSGHPLDFIVLDNSGIHADAFGGPGGNVSIFANVMLSSTPIATAVTASSALSAPGTVNINAVVTDVSGSLAELSTEVLEAAALLRASCAARLAEGKTSSLVVAGREGLPLEPGGLLPSALRELRPAGVAGGAGPFLASEWPGLRRSYLDAACGR